MSEQWRAVVGFDGDYEVSNEGRFRSYVTSCSHYRSRRKEPVVLSPVRQKGYFVVGLRRFGQAARLRVQLHRLVLEAFVGPCPEGMECCHNNGIRDDNRLQNLRWATRRENHFDKKKHGTFQSGDGHYKARLTIDQVMEIRRSNKSDGELAKIYGVSISHIGNIKKGRTWRCDRFGRDLMLATRERA